MEIWHRFVALLKLLQSSFSLSIDEQIERALLKKRGVSAKLLAVGFWLTFFLVASILFVVVARTHSQFTTESRLMLRERGDLIAQLLRERLATVMAQENKRSFSQYRFVMTIPSLEGENVVLSPLAQFPASNDVPGLIGYFQIDPDGSFHTPILPDGFSDRYPVTDRSARTRHARRIEMLVRQSDYAGSGVVERVASKDLLATNEKNRSLVEEDEVPEELLTLSAPSAPRMETQSAQQGKLFDPSSRRSKSSYLNVAIYPFSTLISSRHMIFRRDVILEDQRYVQGFVVSIPSFFTRIFQSEIAYDFMNDVGVRLFSGNTRLLEFGAWDEEPEVVRYELAWPFHEINLDVAYRVLRRGEATTAVTLVGVLFLIGFGAALLLLYRAIVSSVKSAQKRGDFISAVTHELKTPLTGITTNLELLSGDYPMSEREKEVIYERIAGETARLTRLIENVLNISRLERQQLVVHLARHSIDDLVRQFADQLGTVYHNRGFTLNYNLTAGDRPLMLSSDALMLILVNVVDNAVKFSAKAEVRDVDITTRLTENGGAQLIVRDYGTGVPDEDLAQIFRAFYRAENELIRNTLGTGIGLSLVKGFCDLMRVKVEGRNVNPGFEMVFTIPPIEEEPETDSEEVQNWGD